MITEKCALKYSTHSTHHSAEWRFLKWSEILTLSSARSCSCCCWALENRSWCACRAANRQTSWLELFSAYSIIVDLYIWATGSVLLSPVFSMSFSCFLVSKAMSFTDFWQAGDQEPWDLKDSDISKVWKTQLHLKKSIPKELFIKYICTVCLWLQNIKIAVI